MRGKLLPVLVTALATATSALAAEDAYVVGLSGAVTGPSAGTLAPVVETIKAYVDTLNGKGGVNGKQVKLVILDDQAEPSKAAANTKRLIAQEEAVLLINTSLSSTYAPMLTEAKRAGVPVFFAGAVCPKEVYPPADALQFCSTAFGAEYDSQFALGFVKDSAKDPVKLGLAAMAIPLSRGEIDFAEGLSKRLGMTPVDKEIIPPPTADYTPFATKLKEAGPNWIYSWAPWVTQVKTFEALRRLGWQGRYIAYAHLNSEDELARLKDGELHVFGANAFFQDRLPIHAEIRALAERAKINYPASYLAEGYVAALVLEAALKGTPWPATPAKVQAAMSNLKVDTKGLRGGTLEWTKENHFRTYQYYRIYRWDPAKSAVVRVKDWTGFTVK
ncbi:MAG: ABC transporter substrate-binding protein [Deltaproteobacteria bacterium]|nr:ABC transporter substrate-binding protein [Deltaproteobacteria bacterium]